MYNNNNENEKIFKINLFFTSFCDTLLIFAILSNSFELNCHSIYFNCCIIFYPLLLYFKIYFFHRNPAKVFTLPGNCRRT